MQCGRNYHTTHCWEQTSHGRNMRLLIGILLDGGGSTKHLVYSVVNPTPYSRQFIQNQDISRSLRVISPTTNVSQTDQAQLHHAPTATSHTSNSTNFKVLHTLRTDRRYKSMVFIEKWTLDDTQVKISAQVNVFYATSNARPPPALPSSATVPFVF